MQSVSDDRPGSSWALCRGFCVCTTNAAEGKYEIYYEYITRMIIGVINIFLFLKFIREKFKNTSRFIYRVWFVLFFYSVKLLGLKRLKRRKRCRDLLRNYKRAFKLVNWSGVHPWVDFFLQNRLVFFNFTLGLHARYIYVVLFVWNKNKKNHLFVRLIFFLLVLSRANLNSK